MRFLNGFPIGGQTVSSRPGQQIASSGRPGLIGFHSLNCHDIPKNHVLQNRLHADFICLRGRLACFTFNKEMELRSGVPDVPAQWYIEPQSHRVLMGLPIQIPTLHPPQNSMKLAHASPNFLTPRNENNTMKKMKRNLALCAALALTLSPALAGNGTWTNNGSSTWSTTSNWASSTVADGAGFLANFSTIDITANRTVTLDSSRTIGRLIFGDTAWTASGFDWVLASSGGSILTLDNAGGVGGNPPTITVANRGLTISSILAGTNGLNLGLQWSNWDTIRNTSPGPNGGATMSQASGTQTFTANNTLSGALQASGGTVRVGGNSTGGRFGSATALTIAGNGVFINGDATAANNNGITNRIGDGTATLTLGGSSGGGAFTSAFAATGNTTSQTFAGLTVNAGNSVLNSSNTAAGTNNLIFTGTAGGAGYVRNANGLLNVVTAAGFNPQFTNAPTAAGGSSVSGTGGNAILIGALLNGTDFITAAAGNLTAATYTNNAPSSLTSGANINITGQNTTLAANSTVSINSLKFSDNAARTLNLGTGSALTIASGGILTGSAVATTGSTITGGTITSGASDLWIYANGSGLIDLRNANTALAIASKITGGISLTVGGGQKVSLSGANDYTAGTYLNNGLIIVASDGSLGAASGTVTAVKGLWHTIEELTCCHCAAIVPP